MKNSGGSMRTFLVLSLVMSFSVFAQQSRVRENIKQSSISTSDHSEKKIVKQKKAAKKINNEKERGR